MPTAPDFTIRELLDWARTKPARKVYEFCNPNNCIMAQFGKETDREELVGIGDLTFAVGGKIASAAVGARTFGGFVRLLEKHVEPNPFKRCWNRLTRFDPAQISVTVHTEPQRYWEPAASAWTSISAYGAIPSASYYVTVGA